jgi:Domain of unknown function (DU1801)
MSEAPPEAVEAAFVAMPRQSQNRARELRRLVLDTARACGIPGLEETLKWGEPAYLAGKSGTTVRIGYDEVSGDCKLLVNCQTSLVEEWRARFGDRLAFEGNRAVRVPSHVPMDTGALRACIKDAFAYHRAKREIADG